MMCALCGKKAKKYLTFIGNRVVCIDCGKKYGMTKNNEFSIPAQKYANWHTIGDLKQNISKYGMLKITANDDNDELPQDNTRRLIAGIFFLVAAAILVFQSIGVIGGYSLGGISFGVTAGFFGLLLAAAMIVHGIYYIKTKLAYKNKDFEWSWFWVYGILAIIIFGSSAPRYYNDLGNVWPIVVITLWILGYRWGEDQKDLIQKANRTTQNQDTSSINQTTQPVHQSQIDSLDKKADQLKKYKQLLDDKAISQEEYDNIKAKILDK